jgi:Carboxypeptidase regulatory-like domain
MKTRIAQVIKIFGIMALVAAFAASAFPARTFANSSTDYGKVVVNVTTASKPVAGAIVEVLNSKGEAVIKTVTDTNGMVSFPLLVGEYKLRVTAKGYNLGEGSVAVEADTLNTVNINLTPSSNRSR